ncbi:MAG TPA: class I adenylate-forming enzyme family protein [Acidimicrobiales bacterium]|nr:class I adenylate-forming enzyme family protein [Acidimicrobiales bacterium]
MDSALSARRLHATHRHARSRHYGRVGGPWDRGPLDSGFSPRSGAVVDRHGRIDAAALEDLVDRLAGGLRAAGARRGRVVSWQLPNGAEALLLYRACWRLGAVAAPLHHRLGPAEVEEALAQVDPAVVLAAAHLPTAGVAGVRLLDVPGGAESLLDLFGAADPVPVADTAARGSDLAVALFTSGSTGKPKAALHTHRGLGYKAASMVQVHGLGGDDVVLMPAPLAHISGLLNGVLIPASAGITSVLMDTWDPDEGLARIESERVTFMGAPPVFFSQMVGSAGFSAERVASLRLVSTGGASVSPAFVDATTEAFGCRVKRTYGSTEAPTVTTSGPDDAPALARDTDGRCVGEAELSVRDPETGTPVGPGVIGELWLRGPELFVGYADQEATDRVISKPGGWFRSGDLGSVDAEGWLVVTGRLSDIIIRAGENISASEVEAALEAHPAVRHAVAVGVPDAALGERVAVFVEATGPFDLATCRTWFAERGITRFKTPEFVVRLDALPALAAGKPDRAALRARAASLSAG